MAEGRIVRVIAFDPGPTETGWARAVIGKDPLRRVRFEAGGNVPSSDAKLLEVLDAAGDDAIVAVETPKGYVFHQARGAQLLETRGVADTIATLARVRGQRVLQLPMQTWRRAICGKGIRGTAGDDAVRRAVELHVVDLPRRSNNHMRDALGLAIVALLNPNAAKGTR